METQPLTRNFVIWLIVCWLAAAPSFWMGAMVGDMRPSALAGMTAGVFLFVFAYTYVSSTRWAQRFKHRPFVLRTLKIGYSLRIVQSVLSIVPPIMMADMFFGMMALTVTSAAAGIAWDPGTPISSPAGQFSFHFATTVVEGVLLNIVLFVLMLLIWGFQRLFLKVPMTDDPTKFCAGCGYDLRASRIACPECGEAIAQLN